MPVISKLQGIPIRTYGLDTDRHQLPHMHADYRERRIFDVTSYLDRGVFRQLRVGLFSAARAVASSIEWSGSTDLWFDTLYLRSAPAPIQEASEVQP